MKDRWTARISIPFIALLIGISLTALAVLVLYWSGNWQAKLDDVLKVVATGIASTTALYAALNFARLNASHEENIELKKKELTAKLIERWQDPKFSEAVTPVLAFIKVAPTLSPEQLAEKIDGNEQLRSSAMLVLNALEALAVQLNHAALHNAMARDYFRGVVVTYHTRLAGLISLARNRTSNPRLFVELERLASSWGTT